MATWLRKHGTPLLIWIALAVLPVLYATYAGVSWHPLNPHEHLVQNGLAYCFLLLFSYFNHTVFVPRWYLNKRYARYVTVAVLCILGAVYLPYRIEQWVFFKKPKENTAAAWVRQVLWAEMMLDAPDQNRFGPERDGKPWERGPAPSGGPFAHEGPPRGDMREGGPDSGNREHAGRDMKRAGKERPARSFSVILPAKLAIFFLLGSLSSLVSILIQATNRLRRMENDQLQAELGQLKAQIQPHFLFNTLNSIYALAIRNDERTADTIVKLSDFLRYMIRDAHRDKVPLATEVNYIANYIELQQARLRDAVQVDYRLDGQPEGLLIAPLLLSSFIENAFKYGVNPEEESPIRIHLQVRENTVRLAVANRKVQVSQLEESTGIGLRNTRERLRLTYPGAHELTIDDSNDEFKVNLFLDLT